MHKPVLLNEVLEFLNPKPGNFIIDGTVDGGGHSKEIIKKIGSSGQLLGVDLDPEMVKKTRRALGREANCTIANGNYADLKSILKKKKLGKANGLLLDLGFSSEQIDNSGRGFSFNVKPGEEPLLMTYSDDFTPVKDILRGLKEEEIAKIIFDYSGEKFSRRIAASIKSVSRIRKIETSYELAEIIRKAVPRGYERGRIDPATRTFQALRIYANHELENLERILVDLPEILVSGGRAVIISFHSLEDKIVKQAFREFSKNKIGNLITKKPIGPTREEEINNPRSRSAKLRVLEII